MSDQFSLPVRMGDNDSEIVDANGALVAYVFATATTNRTARAKLIIKAINEAGAAK